MGSSVDHTQRLPPEILSEIFLFASSSFWTRGMLSPRQFPLLLGQICRRWRGIALGTPRLWFRIQSWPKLPLSCLISMVSVYIERSKPLPLKLSFDATCDQTLRDLFVNQSHRWGHVSIEHLEIQLPSARPVISAFQNDGFEHLRTLELRVAGHIPGETRNIMFPNLRSLTLIASSTDPPRHFSTPRVKHLRLDHPYSYKALEHIGSFLRRCCSTLACLELANVPVHDFELIGLIRLVPRIVDLNIHCGQSRAITQALLSSLHSTKAERCLAPKLKSLSLGGNVSASEDLLLDVIESRCGPTDVCEFLRRVELHLVNPYDVRALTRLRALLNSGMEVSVFKRVSRRPWYERSSLFKWEQINLVEDVRLFGIAGFTFF
ncbi:hypothetical protein R3P38DRAFT_2833586 [Favolaschia claudopus]|uniref:F-box domain-containing protein n=1 Tax=Favolaschia claudopus TaxID=2862362 RepID=A0AAW0ECY9_9AGAR